MRLLEPRRAALTALLFFFLGCISTGRLQRLRFEASTLETRIDRLDSAIRAHAESEPRLRRASLPLIRAEFATEDASLNDLVIRRQELENRLFRIRKEIIRLERLTDC